MKSPGATHPEVLPPLPPEKLRRGVGDGDFWQLGGETAGLIRELCGDLTGARVLDVGCGLGRVAFFLSRELGAQGSYLGFDTSDAYVRWCRENLGLDKTRFEFLSFDLKSTTYNPRGALAARDFEFPGEDGAFDFVVATSLFTHLEADAATRYLREGFRVLRPGGKLFATFYVLNDEALGVLEGEKCFPAFYTETEYGRIADPDEPEAAVAFDQEWLADLVLKDIGFELESFEDGWWRQKQSRFYQDIVVLRKPLVLPELPPPELRLGIGDGPFWETGREVADHIGATLGDMAGKSMLDIGSGLGRVAFFLQGRLGRSGRYTGVDINADYVSWAETSLGLPQEQFNFQTIEPSSTVYNPSGSLAADAFRFPFSDRSFDLVVATSLFTHLEGAATRNYLAEVYRMLVPGGKLYATFYVLNDDCRERVEKGETHPTFPVVRDFGRLVDEQHPEQGVAHDQDWLAHSIREQLGFELLAFDYGYWRRNQAPHYQDVVILRRPESAR